MGASHGPSASRLLAGNVRDRKRRGGASQIRFHWHGHTQRFSDVLPADSTFFPYAIGDKIRADLHAANQLPRHGLSSLRGEYYNPTGIYDIGPVLAVDIGGTGGFAIHQYLQVFNNYTDANGETYDGLTFEVGEPQRGWQSRFLFRTSDLSVLDSDAIPTDIDPGDFEIATFQRLARPGERVGGGTIDVVTNIPEPGTMALLGAALLGFVALRRRARG